MTHLYMFLIELWNRSVGNTAVSMYSRRQKRLQWPEEIAQRARKVVHIWYRKLIMLILLLFTSFLFTFGQ